MLELTFPTDRDRDAPDHGVGVDTVAVAGPTTDLLLLTLRHQQLDRDVDLETGEVIDTPTTSFVTMPVGSCSVRLHGYRHHGSPTLRIELSLPTMLHGHNRNSVRRDVLMDAVDAALASLTSDLPDVPQVDQVALQRLDLARDFRKVTSPPATLLALGSRHVPYAQHHERHHRPDGNLQCVERGSVREYLIRGYDKTYEMSRAAHRQRDPDRRQLLLDWADASPGHLRFELQLRAPLLRRKGLITMTECTPEKLDSLARDYYAKARWNTPYGSRGRVLTTLQELRPTLSRATYRNLLLYVLCQGRGIDPDLSRHALEAVRPLARRHDLLDTEDDLGPRRLDFDEGREVAAE